ncbi:MAG: hypothetical protein RLZZ502_1042 [Pseudomonadota bacterium]
MSEQNLPIRWTKNALASAQAIDAFIAQDSPTQAINFVAELKDKISLLRRFPHMGKDGRINGTRELTLHEKYYVVYRVRQGAVEIIRLRHVAQKSAALGGRA